MKKIAILIFVILICLVFTANFLKPEEFEIRNGFLNNFLSFSFYFWIFTTYLILLLVWNIRREKRKSINGLSSFILMILCMVSIVISGFFTAFTPPNKKDAIVYKNLINQNDKIICQFYLTGITSDSPNWRVIRTNNQNALIRKIEIIKDTNTISNLNISDFPKKHPKNNRIRFENKTYKLENYMIWKNWNEWEKYKKTEKTNR